MGVLELLGSELGGNQICLHSLEHVLVALGCHLLEIVLLDQSLKLTFVILGSGGLHGIRVREHDLLLSFLLELPLEIIQLLLLGLDRPVDSIELEPE